MNLKIDKIYVSRVKSLNPELILDINISYYPYAEIITDINGVIKLEDTTIIGNVNEPFDSHSDKRNESTLGWGLSATINNLYYIDKQQYIHTKLSIQIDKLTINYIEKIRHKTINKDVKLHLSLYITTMKINNQHFNVHNLSHPNHLMPFLVQKREQCYADIIIPQSDWVNQFLPHLNVGNFLLLELKSLSADNFKERFLNSPFPSIQTDFYEIY